VRSLDVIFEALVAATISRVNLPADLAGGKPGGVDYFR
jgi:hypothetical protein